MLHIEIETVIAIGLGVLIVLAATWMKKLGKARFY